VISASDGAEAWNAVQEEPGIDLLLTDIEMPAMDGLELAWRVRTEFPEIQILFTSGSERIRDLPEAMVLVKPFTSEDLLAAIERLLLRLRRAA
jgi:CheY-like chemotaxis protein